MCHDLMAMLDGHKEGKRAREEVREKHYRREMHLSKRVGKTRVALVQGGKKGSVAVVTLSPGPRWASGCALQRH